MAKGTPVLMFSGVIKPVEQIKRGDLLMGPDSKPRRVLNTCKGREMMYKVTPVKGDPYTVNESHILSLKKTGTHARSKGGKGDIINISIRDYVESSKTFKQIHKGWRSPVDWDTKALPELLPPYLLGLWLGGGCSRTSSITSADKEIHSYISDFAKVHGLGFRVESNGGDNKSVNLHITHHGKWYKGVKGELRRYNLLQNKHVPHIYKCNDRENRKLLLAGLMDSDGSLHRTGYDYISKNETLANDVAYVSRSLGYAAYVKKCVKKCYNTGVVGEYFRVSISGDTSDLPVKIMRKKAPIRRQKKSVNVTGIQVEATQVDDYYGFEIDGDHLFMLGDFTVTHNTICFSAIINEHNGAAAAVVHRKEIVGQISLALAKLGVKHRIIAPMPVVTRIRRKHLKEIGKSYVEPRAVVGVISVQTLTSGVSERNRGLQRWLKQITLCVYDEGHHYVEQGLWAKAVHAMENAKLLFVTATPERADGRGLGHVTDGFAETMVEGPSTQWLIDQGYLCSFKYKAPKTNLDVSDIPITASGDLNTKAMRKRIVESELVGDVVSQYLQFAKGKRAIVFANDVATAEEMATAFNASGVVAAALSGQTDQGERDNKLDQFEGGQISVLVNVDLFDEGFDVPAVEAVILARVTESLAKYLQMVGRALRVVYAQGFDLSTTEGRLGAIAAGNKPHALVIDPVRNWERHGMPNWPRVWSLEGREKGSRGSAGDLIPQRVCLACTQPYEKFYDACPFCGEPAPEPVGRSAPEQVEGNLEELDVEAMSALFEKMRRADMSAEEYALDQERRFIPKIGRRRDMKRHLDSKYRRDVLRNLVAWWVGCQPDDRTQSEIHKRFFYRFGVDIGTAFTLKSKETDELIKRIEARFNEDLRDVS